MAIFEIQGPGGAIFEVDAPDERAAIAGFRQFSGGHQASFDERFKGEDITRSSGDKYNQAAVNERDNLKARGVDTGAGVARRFIQGRSLGIGDEILAALQAPLEAVKHHTFDPNKSFLTRLPSALKEGYNYAKAREDLIMDDSRKDTGMLGSVAEVAGGVGTGLDAARSGLTFARNLAPGAGLGARSAASAGDAAGFGLLSGAAEGNSLSERAGNAALGGVAGGILGGTLPGIFALGGQATAPIVSNIRARLNPEGYATKQLSRALSESGKTAQQVAREVEDAAAAGQGVFTVADALGNPGQRMLSTVTRAPGKGRTEAVEFLERRQAGQGDRLSQITDEALGAGATARQTSSKLTKTAQDESAPFYQEALNQKPVWTPRIQQFFEDPVTKAGLKEGVAVQRLESLAQGKKFDPNDYAITGFNEAGDPIISGVPNMRTINLIKKGWDNQLEKYRDGVTGKLRLDEYGRALDSVRRSFLKEVDAVNPAYAKARALYAGPAQVRDAVAMGGKAAGRGRAADNLDQFNSLSDASKQGFRTGYADHLSQGFERGAMGVNKVRPLTSDKAREELQALSLHQGPVAPGQLDPLSQRLGREHTMFETRRQAIGGSQTADNLADSDALGVDPSIFTNLLSGNISGAAKGLLSAGSNAWSGNTAPVREALAEMLLQRGQAGGVQQALTQAQALIDRTKQTMLLLSRGAMGGTSQLPAQRQ